MQFVIGIQSTIVEYYVSYQEGILGDKVDGLFTPDATKGEKVYISYKTYCNSATGASASPKKIYFAFGLFPSAVLMVFFNVS